ncbi:Crp/Fnr family transcriptional regulator [Clostridium sp. Marseille-P299]|uniref:Crp/Fnr family transcriptional regulator n=1 Tax=Clostridium sp. Marseille-P299 TaxID=1805477 RepID=UPI00082B2949|nr:Crp/Fnr family transcriptional regulator [Clostridium sp. Marseille-P299]
MTLDEKHEIIKSVFSNSKGTISKNTIEQILKISNAVRFNKNEMILNMFEEQNVIYLIISGIVRSYYLDKNGNDVTKSFIKENEFCIGESLFTNDKSPQGFEALENILCLKFKAFELKDLILQDEILTRTYIEYLEKYLIYKMEREWGFQMLNATERYIKFRNNYSEIDKRVNQSYIASYLGITPESLSRIRRTVADKN